MFIGNEPRLYDFLFKGNSNSGLGFDYLLKYDII